MKLWIDADAAPREVKEICFRASERLELDTVLVANQRIQLPAGYRYLSAVRVDGGPDVADIYIGVETAGHAAYGVREKQLFANSLDRALTRARLRLRS